MSISTIFPRIRSIVAPTLSLALDRFERLYEDLGWVDMKFDPATGKERGGDAEGGKAQGGETGEFYRRDRVYGWIQGRALESLAAHGRWLSGLRGYRLLGRRDGSGQAYRSESERVAKAASDLYRTLRSRCFKDGEITAAFVMDPQGNSLGPSYPAGSVTLSHLFCLRGMAAYAVQAGLGEEESEAILAALRRAVDAAVAGECIDDQVRFGDRGGESYTLERRGYEGQMIALGACGILYEASGAQEDLDRGLKAISYVRDEHLVLLPRAGAAMVDAFGPGGEPLLEEGRLGTNPGHAIEFAGLVLGFFRRAAAKAGSPEYPREWTDTIESFSRLVVRYHGMCRAPHGGVVRSMDAATGQPIQDFCPWWSSFEAARTFAEMYAVADTDFRREYCLAAAESYLSAIEGAYLGPSAVGVPVQTIGYDGGVLPIIPATPDIDAGYHTGMPLLEAYGIFARHGASSSGNLLFGAAEADIAPRIGARLQGHAARTRPAEGELDRLKARCLVLQSPATQLALISADVLEFSHAWSESVCRALEASFGVAEDAVLLFATHTHTAPPSLALGLVDADPAFLRSLESSVLEAARKALGGLAPGFVRYSSARSDGLGVNRRSKDPLTGKVRMAPNFSGPADSEVPVLWLEDAEGRVRCVLANPAIHPTTLGVSISMISADYPGRLSQALRGALGGVGQGSSAEESGIVVIPIQGACGDVRPAVLDGSGKEFAEGSEADIDRIGQALARSILASREVGRAEAIAEAIAEARPGDRLAYATRRIRFPFAPAPEARELSALLDPGKGASPDGRAGPADKDAGFAAVHENPGILAKASAAWAEKSLGENYDSQGLYIGPGAAEARVSLARLAQGIYLFCIPGEVFSAIGLGLKERASPDRLLIGGYCGGTLGYMPTEEAFSQGGYEVESAYRFYGYPAALSPGTEALLHSVFDEMKSTLEKENSP